MKKLMIMAAIVCAATVSQAAKATWNSGALYRAASKDGGISTKTEDKIMTAGTVQGYYFSVSETLYNAIAKDFSQKAVYDAFTANGTSSTLKFGEFDAVTVNKTGSNLATGTMAIQDSNTYAGGDDVYGVVIYTYTDKDYGDMYVANIGSGHYDTASNKSFNNMANTFGGGGTAANNNVWQSVPEPTSGLLLLLGVAGLALRRRRA